MSEKESIHMEDETTKEAGGTWTEEIKVAADELIGMVKSLVFEANVRRIVVMQGDNMVMDIPLLVGIGGIAMLPMLAALSVITALATDHSILVERRVVAEKSAA